jgi:hypothetical protein
LFGRLIAGLESDVVETVSFDQAAPVSLDPDRQVLEPYRPFG